MIAKPLAARFSRLEYLFIVLYDFLLTGFTWTPQSSSPFPFFPYETKKREALQQ